MRYNDGSGVWDDHGSNRAAAYLGFTRCGHLHITDMIGFKQTATSTESCSPCPHIPPDEAKAETSKDVAKGSLVRFRWNGVVQVNSF